ncbi:Hsp20/alpha crystallin family protein [Lentilactobacillus sp. Marseille-Q4993]|uniref:Hsp20/alpha crystallin family protein n=1 Tax=Lentilactobacillus sp. Marseille-Q4993 TaxID=3039492 RepID=UPI0024BC3344|nr:Hsp20/alpha crystallin family protein [Lentilactobacillus sp. Marseille-Q4993]
MANALMNRFDMDPFFDKLSRRFFSPNDVDNSFFDQDNLKTDIKETDNDYQVKVDIPGVDKKDINVAYKNDVLSLSINHSSEKTTKDDDGRIIASERSHGMLSRSYQLPNVDYKKVTAKYSNGVLAITLPKQEGTTDSNHIEIE